MSYFDNNIALLEKTNPILAAQIQATPYDAGLVKEVSPGVYDIVNTDGQFKYSGRPLEEASNSLKLGNLTTYAKFVMFYGIGLGYALFDFIKSPNKVTNYIVLIEKSLPLVRASMELFDWSSVLTDSRVTMIVGVQEGRPMDLLFEEFMITDSGRFIVLRANNIYFGPCASKDEIAYYEKCANSFKNAVSHYSLNIIGDDDDAYYGFTQLIRNLPTVANYNAVDELVGKFRGYPAILVGAGPSLKHNYEWLRQVQHKAVIAVCDAALRSLVDNGITPHFVCTLERTPNTKFFYENIPPLPNTWLVAAPIVTPELYTTYQGPVLNMMRGIAQMSWYFGDDHELFPTGHGVTNQLFTMLDQLGCSKVFFVGQDLAYDRFSNDTHGVAIPDNIQGISSKQRAHSLEDESGELVVEGNNGQPIQSERSYVLFRKELELQLVQAKKEYYNVIYSDYGAKIIGTTLVDPDKALEFFNEDYPVLSTIKSNLKPITANIVSARMQHFYDRSKLAMSHLEIYQNISLDVLDSLCFSKMAFMSEMHNNDFSSFDKLFKGIESVSEELFEDSDNFFWRFFMGQFTTKMAILCHYSQELMARKFDKAYNFKARVVMATDWFTTIHKWSSRMNRFLERNVSLLEKKKGSNISESRASV